MKYVNGPARLFTEYIMLLKIKLHCIELTYCSHLSPYGTLQRIISFMLTSCPFNWAFTSFPPIIPTKSICVTKSHLLISFHHISSTYFGPEKTHNFMTATLNSVYPQSVITNLSVCKEKDDIVRIIQSHSFLFDSFQYDKNGRLSKAKDIKRIVQLAIPQPRRTSFSCTCRTLVPLISLKTNVNELFVYGAGG